DIDLFIIVEDGKLWAFFLIAMLWAKAKGLRKRLCMNYLISDAVLPLFERDLFTAQQAASLKPVFGKSMYDRFIRANSFLYKWFPNFKPARHRMFYPEIEVRASKSFFEALLGIGPIQIVEWFSRFALGRYFLRKCAARSDIRFDARHLKL